MNTFKDIKSLLFSNDNALTFNDKALHLFRYQARHNPLYEEYVSSLGIDPSAVTSVEEIPFLPISLFKTHTIKTGEWVPEQRFLSSGTTGTTTSTHFVFDLRFYLLHAQRCFEMAFGPLSNYHLFALLPSYLERQNSSLVEMIRHFILCTKSPFSNFYLYNHDQLIKDVIQLKSDTRKVILWGVSFALLDLAQMSPDFSHCMVFETGGMKGRRKEITRNELHESLKTGLNVDKIYSEYGMTELLSQSYTRGGSKFYCSEHMRILTREVTDPMTNGIIGENGVINVIDLANFHSIGFIGTEDLGKVHENGTFEVLGRVDNSDVRGCNLLMDV